MKKKDTTVVDVLSHKLVPEMKVLSDAEKIKVLKEFAVSQDQLPRIFSTDSEVVALKGKEGEVIKIKRNDGTGEYIAYRVVVEG